MTDSFMLDPFDIDVENCVNPDVLQQK